MLALSCLTWEPKLPRPVQGTPTPPASPGNSDPLLHVQRTLTYLSWKSHPPMPNLRTQAPMPVLREPKPLLPTLGTQTLPICRVNPYSSCLSWETQFLLAVLETPNPSCLSWEPKLLLPALETPNPSACPGNPYPFCLPLELHPYPLCA